MQKLVTIAYSSLFWVFTFFWTALVFSMIFCHKFLYGLAKRPGFEIVCHRYATMWADKIFKITPIWDIEIDGFENLPLPGEAVVITANHESMSDIWALYYLNIQFRWLSKIEVFNLPMIGKAMEWAGYIPIKRGDKQSHVAAMAKSQEHLKQGTPMLFFPEGTRSEDGTMRPFKIGAFKLADESQVAILPIALKGAGNLIRKGSPIICPATVRVQVLPRTWREEEENIEQYAARVRKLILNAHAKL